MAAISSAALADLPERRFIQTLQPEIEELPLPQAFLGFGAGIAMQSDLALVGNGGDMGYVAAFGRQDRFWRRSGALQCPGPICGPIALEDDVAIVHAYDMNSGVQTLSIFRYEQGNWTVTDSIPKPLPDLPDLWVRTANYHHRMLATTVGPTFSNVPAEVYVYKLDANATVRRTFKLAPSDPNPEHNFGSDIAIGDGVIAVSDFFWSASASAPRTGAVYIFERRGAAWVQTQILTADDGQANDQFGRRIVMAGDLLLVGAPRATRNGNEGSTVRTGAIYAFHRTDGTWTQRAKFAPSSRQFGQYTEFGSRMAISRTHAVIAARPPNSSADRGLAFEYLVRHDRLVPVAFVRAFSPPTLALQGETMFIGSGADNPESPVGHVAVYDLNTRIRPTPFCEAASTARAAAFCDDFENGTAESWQPFDGTWSVDSREYVGRAGTDQCGTGFSSNESLIRHLDAADVDVRLEMRAIERVDKGIVLRSTSAGDQIELNFRASPFFNDLVVQELVGCQFNFLDAAAVPHEMGQVLHVHVRLVGRRLTVWVDGQLVLDRSLPFRAKHGGVGLAVITDHGVSAFDNVRVKALK